METIDARKQLIRLRKKEISNKGATEIVGIAAGHGSTIWQKYLRGGLKAVKPGIRGRKIGSLRTLQSRAGKGNAKAF